MTILVDDPLTINPKLKDYCHLWSSTNNVEELHAFAAKLGLKKVWFQISVGASGEFPHYDISPRKRNLALGMGARYKSLRDWIRERTKEQSR